MEQMRILDGEDLPEWVPLFDPQHFQQEHPQLLLTDWELNQDDLFQLANQVSEIRKMIAQKAVRHANALAGQRQHADTSINRDEVECEVDEPSLLQQHIVDQIADGDQEENRLAVAPQVPNHSVPFRRRAEPNDRDRQKDKKRSRIGLEYSTAAKHPNGLSEKEIRAQLLLEKPAGRKYKKKHRRQLASADIEKILEAYSEGDQT